MPLYTYNAIDTLGKKRTGALEAHSEKEAKSILREQGVMVIQIGIKKATSRKENLNSDQLLSFTMQLSQLVGAGVPVYESLVAIEEQYREESNHRIILSLCEQIKRGTRLSEAMAQFPESFERLYVAMIAAGESVGSLHLVLEKLTDLLAKQNKLRKDIFTAMIYPTILAGFAFIVIGVLLGFVVPSIEGIFSDRQLNTFTTVVLGASHFFRDYWWIYLPLCIGLGVWIFFKLRSAKGKAWLERSLMRLPLASTLMIQAAVVRFCRTMATLLKGGLPIIDSLRISRETMGNALLEEEVKQAEARIIEGSSLSRELGKSKLIPPMVSRMLSVGEDTGNIMIMLQKIADMYELELSKTLARIMALAQPVILVFMGLVIGFILMAILLPLADMSSFAI